MSQDDKSLESLLDLDSIRYVVDEESGYWVKFEVKKVEPSKDRPHGIKYSLTLHDRSNKRIMGYDNSHPIEYGGKKSVAPKKYYDHWHKDENDIGRPYKFVDAGKLMTDFWNEVDKICKRGR